MSGAALGKRQVLPILSIMRNYLILTAMAAALLFSGCGKDDPEPVPEPEPDPIPAVNATIGSVTRTSVSFSIATDIAVDWAYQILPQTEAAPTVESLFETSATGMFEDGTSVNIEYSDLTGGGSYVLYAAARTLNPMVYSELFSVEFSTDIPFTDVITLESVGLRSYSYHIMNPSPGSSYKHLCVDKSDYDWMVNYMGTTPHQYLSAFGLTETADTTFVYETSYEYGYSSVVNIYSGKEYMIIAGTADENGQVAEGDAYTCVFSTKKADEAPYGIDVKVSDITSLRATVTITPEEGIVMYRAYVDTEANFGEAEFEGEAAVRRYIIGNWSDTENEYTEATSLSLASMTPNTEYRVGVVGFDAQNREKVVFVNFSTTEPTGPKPEFTIAKNDIEKPWNSASFTVTGKYVVDARTLTATKASVDEVLSREGNEDLTIGDVILGNGNYVYEDELALLLGDGLVCSAESLTPETEYIFGVYGVNEEQVGGFEYITFTTDAMPQMGGEVRANMPGEYTATMTDQNGSTVTFPVTIATGVNDATTEEYRSKNRLVCLGFGACGLEYQSPADLLANGWASTEEEANANYGPKWFIEFVSDDEISTSVQTDFVMAKYNGFEYYFHGFRTRPNGTYMNNSQTHFPVTVSEDGNTITIGQTENYGYTYYPGVNSGSSAWSTNLVVMATSDIVLTRNAQSASSAGKSVAPAAQLKSIKKVSVAVGGREPREKMFKF